MVADDDAHHTGADRLDDTGSLVTQNSGAARLCGAVDRIEIRVADAGSREAHEDLTWARWREIEVLNVERASGRLENGGTDLHGAPAVSTDGGPAAWRARSSSSGMWQRIR